LRTGSDISLFRLTASFVLSSNNLVARLCSPASKAGDFSAKPRLQSIAGLLPKKSRLKHLEQSANWLSDYDEWFRGHRV